MGNGEMAAGQGESASEVGPALEHFEAQIHEWLGTYKIAGSFAGLAGIAAGCSAVDLAVLFSAVGLIFFVVAQRRKKHRRRTAPGVEPPSLVNRSERIREITDRLRNEEVSLLVVTGRSGAGKSELVKMLSKKLGGYKSATLHDYAVQQIQAEVEALPSNRKVLLVFDQLEKLFLMESASRPQVAREISNAIDLCHRRKGWKCLLVLRREWFVDLRVFGSVVPRPVEAVMVDGLSGLDEPGALAGFRDLLRKILVDNPDLADAILADCQGTSESDERAAGTNGPSGQGRQPLAGDLLPVEAVTVAHAFRWMRSKKGRSIKEGEYQTLGGARGAMEQYFRAYLASFEREGTATSILASLSVNPRGHRRLSAQEIVEVTNIPLGEVESVLERLVESRLLDTTDHLYDWSHDFFAERFSEVSGSLLEPTNRDNIAYFWGKLGRRDAPPRTPWKSRGWADSWGILCFSAAFGLLWLRFLAPFFDRLLGPALALSPTPMLTASFLQTSNVDWTFLPIVLSLTGWSWYVTQLFRRVLSRLHERSWRLVLSYLVAAWSTLLVILSILWPSLWIVFVGAGGVAVGVKFLMIAFQAERKRMEREVFFGSAGALTVFNSLLTMAGGVLFWAAMTPGTMRLNLPFGLAEVSADAVQVATAVVATAVMLFFTARVASLHINRKVAPILVGTYQRYCRHPAAS